MMMILPPQPDVLLRRSPPLHGEQRGHGDGVVSAGPAADEAAHVLLLPEQLRGGLMAADGGGGGVADGVSDVCLLPPALLFLLH